MNVKHKSRFFGKRTAFVSVIVAAAMVLGIFTVPAAAYPKGWTIQTVPTPGGVEALEVSVDACANYVWVAYRVNTAGGAIYVQRSTDYGATWEDPVVIEDGTCSTYPGGLKIQQGSNNGAGGPIIWLFYASARDTGEDGECEVWIARSMDLGVTWPTDASTNPGAGTSRWHTGSIYRQARPDADVCDGTNRIIFVYDEKYNGTHEEVKYGGYIDTSGLIKPYTDVWLSPLGDNHSNKPKIACENNGDAIVVWTDYPHGSYTRNTIGSASTGDLGLHWSSPVTIAGDSDRKQDYPQINWDYNNPVMLCQEYNYNSSSFYLSRYYWNDLHGYWCDNTGANPPTVQGSEVENTGSVPPYPAITGPWSYERRLYENLTGRVSLYDDYGSFISCTDLLGTIKAKNIAGALAVEGVKGDSKIAAAGEDGKVYFRRADLTPPADINITNPATSESTPLYVNGDFDISCTAADNFPASGSEIAMELEACNGIRRVRYEYSEDGTVWNPMECSGGVEDGGLMYALEPPYTLTASGKPLAGKTIKVRACAEDTACQGNLSGNEGYAETPGWVMVDMEPPGSVLQESGTEGHNGFYMSFAGCTLTSTDPNTARLEYQLSNCQDGGGAVDNWTTYTKAFTLTDGIWNVRHRAIDKAGNVGDTRTDTVKVDTVDPVCSITKPKRDTIQTGYYADETFGLGGTGTDINGLQWAGIYVDDKKVYDTTSDFDMEYVWSLQGVSEGNHMITVKALDAAGNLGSSSKNVWIGNAVKDWYFAEGNTLPEMDEYICLMNPGDTDALVQISFMLEDGRVINHERSMRPHQRDTVKVKDYVEEGHHVSTKVHCSETAIIAERPMYFRYKGIWKGGHNAMGVNVLQNDWYFAEGTTRKNSIDGLFEEWITIMNPDESKTANITITYMLGDGSNVKAYYSVQPHSRLTVEVEQDVGIDKDISAKVSSDIPVAAERPMYFNYHGYAIDGSDVVGTSGPNDIWYFAEGATHPGFQEWLTIQNPNDVNANCKITYMTGTGVTTTFDKIVPPRSRGTVDVLSQVGDNENVSTKVESDVPIIAERPMYFIYGADVGKGWDGGEAAMGNPDPSTQYFLAEGCTITNFDTWYTLQNPRDGETCNVTIEYCFGDGSTQNLKYVIEPHSRLTINVNDAVKRLGDVSGAITASFPIVIERPMYFNYQGITGGHDVVGFGVD